MDMTLFSTEQLAAFLLEFLSCNEVTRRLDGVISPDQTTHGAAIIIATELDERMASVVRTFDGAPLEALTDQTRAALSAAIPQAAEPAAAKTGKAKLLATLAALATSPNGDKEQDHVNADDALLEFINDPEISTAYDAIYKWYA